MPARGSHSAHALLYLTAVRSRADASTRTVSRTHHDPPGAV